MELQEEYDIGDTVLCDYCNEDFTESDEKGGVLFGSYGICPRCAPKALENIKKYNEEDQIRGRAQEGETFKAFIIRIRNGNNKIRFYA